MTAPESPVSATVVTPAAQHSASPARAASRNAARRALRLELREPGESRRGNPARAELPAEPGQLEMRVRVDQAGKQDARPAILLVPARRAAAAPRRPARPRRSGHPPDERPRRARSAGRRRAAPSEPRAGAPASYCGAVPGGPVPPMTPVRPAGRRWRRQPACPPCGAGRAGAVSGRGSGGGRRTRPPITPPTEPNGEWIGQNAVGSVPGMNDSM